MVVPGLRCGNFHVLEPLGAGGMGEVFRARDVRLGRDVALKVLPARVQLDPHRLARFEREARVLAALNHPNIATLHGLEELDGTQALVLELVDGETLADKIERGRAPLAEALSIATQIAAALEAAHERGIVHRDLKPSNVKLRADATVKLLDFGIAKVFAPEVTCDSDADMTMTAPELVAGEIPLLGTPAYMSPEQARGSAVDKRTDVWAFGCVLYELLAGRRAFAGDRIADVIAKVIEGEPDYEYLRPSTPPSLVRLLKRCLVKDPRQRLRDIGDARLEIEEMQYATTSDGNARSMSPAAHGPAATSSRVAVAPARFGGYALTAVLAGGLAVALYWFVSRDLDRQWLFEDVIPRIEASLDVADWESAYALAKEAATRVGDSSELDELWTRIAWDVSIASDPPAATVYRRAYDAVDDEWEELGRTPLEGIRVPYGLSQIRFTLDGYRPLLRALGGGHLNWGELTGADMFLDNLLVGPELYRLDTDETLPAGKVRVPGWELTIGGEVLALRDFFLGRYEVTNAEFKRFVDAGGYRDPTLWDPIVVDGEVTPFHEAVATFTDRTGRPGPSTWVAGDFAEGEADFPVSGVSWYEAAAYARFVGEELPTAAHWQRALAKSMFPWLLPASNFSGEGPRAVGESRAMNHVGAFDMTGNVREWTATALHDERIILGGSWMDPYYIAGTDDTSASPLDRSAGNGLRLAITEDEPAVATRVGAPMTARTTVTPILEQEPVSDEVYAAYGRFFDYPPRALNPSSEPTERSRMWSRTRIWFSAAYGAETMLLYLYLPTTGSPPYQTVVYWPGWDTFRLDDVDQYFAKQIDFIVKNGRAVAFPIYKGSFERRTGDPMPEFDTTAYRDNTIDTVKDLRRTIDYLETRTDIDHGAIAFFGYSWGGVNGPTALAQEPRLRLGVINIGLLPPMASTPEVDPVSALPRVKVPVLMFSGEFDAMVPIDNARRYFDLIGVPQSNKRHVEAIGGHYVPRDLLIRETLDWLDKHLGPVAP